MAPQSTPRLTVYADYVCPFCYLGRASLATYRESREVPLAVEWHPFDLRAGQRRADGSIDWSVDTGKDDAYFEEASANVRRLADEYDVEMTRDLARDVDSRNAQLASLHLQTESPDDWLEFDRSIYEALWQDDRDVGDPAVLADLARDVGLEDSLVRHALDDEAVERQLEDRFDAARRRGVSGVPTFVGGEHSVRGAVPPAQLRRLVEGA
jgi:predicted DsbA family dithiol-disulfide isomerase